MADDKVMRPRKSRAGCRNCKIRKVKCDEERPQCSKCMAYGVVCNYQQTVPDLQLATEKESQWGVFSVSESSPEPASQQHGRASTSTHQPGVTAHKTSSASSSSSVIVQLPLENASQWGAFPVAQPPEHESWQHGRAAAVPQQPGISAQRTSSAPPGSGAGVYTPSISPPPGMPLASASDALGHELDATYIELPEDVRLHAAAGPGMPGAQMAF